MSDDDTDHGKMCDRCKCCEMFRQTCDTCGGEGMTEADEDEDAWEPCETCEGDGGWWLCDCDDAGVHSCTLCAGKGHTSLTCPKRERPTDGGSR